MGNKPVISKQQILDVAFGLASSSGLSGLSIRDVAQACGISVGTVYNSYPTKADLINDVVGRFWSESLADCMPNALASKNFIEFCRSLSSQIARALKNFQTNWLSEIASLDTHDLISAREREEACFAHVRAGLVVALHADPHINHTRLTGPLDPDALCALIWDSMLASIKGNDPTCETLFALVENTLY